MGTQHGGTRPKESKQLQVVRSSPADRHIGLHQNRLAVICGIVVRPDRCSRRMFIHPVLHLLELPCRVRSDHAAWRRRACANAGETQFPRRAPDSLGCNRSGTPTAYGCRYSCQASAAVTTNANSVHKPVNTPNITARRVTNRRNPELFRGAACIVTSSSSKSPSQLQSHSRLFSHTGAHAAAVQECFS
jgi:hypothetical protein